MVARPGTYQASFNSGELSDAVHGRSDIKQFYAGASLFQNAEPVPQGGFDAMPGTRETGFVRGGLSLVAGTLVTSLGPHSAPAVLATLTFVATTAIAAIDTFNLTAPSGFSGQFVIEITSDGINWSQLGGNFTASPTPESRRRAFPPASPGLVSAARLRLITTPDPGTTFTLGTLFAFSEAMALPDAAREFEFTYSVEEAFSVVLTPFNADFYDGDTWLAACPTQINATLLPALTREQRLNTMYVCHPDMEPQRIRRRTNNNDWSCESAPFVNVPLVDYGLTYGNVVSDVWYFNLRWTGSPNGILLDATINGEDIVGPIVTGTDWVVFAANLKTAIENLASVAPGITVTQTSSSEAALVIVNFTGAGNLGSRFGVTARISNVLTAAVSVSHPQVGDPGGEPIMSASRGWPSTAAFYQDRLFTAGFRSEPGALLGSVNGEYLDMNTKIESASGALLVRLDTTGAERIAHIAQSRHLVIFTNDAEYYITDRAIVRTTPPNIARSTRNGIAPAIRPVENEGNLLYMGRSRSILYAAAYSDVAQIYESTPLSLLASHLISGIRTMATQRSSESTDAARLFLVRDDGILVVGLLIRNQDVTAFTRFVTDGLVREVSVDAQNRPYLLVQRQVAGVARLIRERFDPACLMHQQRFLTFGVPTSVITGLQAYEGATVWASADGFFDRSYTVTGGTITLPYAATTVTIGRWTPPRVRTLPLPRLVGERTILSRPARVHTVRGRLAGTSSLAVAANSGPARDVALVKAGSGASLPVAPSHDEFAVTGLAGYSAEGYVEFTQLRPGAFALRSITLEART